MTDISSFGLLTAFAAGIVSFLSPCVLPLVPAYVSYIAGHSLEHSRQREHFPQKLSALALSLCFVLGFSTIFITLGASATMLGQLLLSYRHETNIVGGAIVVVFGLFTAGFLKIPWFQHDFRLHPHVGSGIALLSTYALGLGLPFLAAPLFTGGLAQRLKRLRRAGRLLQIGAGAVMIIMGIAIMTGQLSAFSYWLLDVFPVLAKIG